MPSFSLREGKGRRRWGTAEHLVPSVAAFRIRVTRAHARGDHPGGGGAAARKAVRSPPRETRTRNKTCYTPGEIETILPLPQRTPARVSSLLTTIALSLSLSLSIFPFRFK